MAGAAVTDIRKAEQWLKDAADDIRSERFRPVADEAKRLWQILRQQSNVDLEVFGLPGDRLAGVGVLPKCRFSGAGSNRISVPTGGGSSDSASALAWRT